MTTRPPVPHDPGAPPAPRAPLDRQALERVLARAAELQALSPDAPELLTEEQILELGREVGISPAAMRQALAEERSRVTVPTEQGMTARFFGASRALATRTVPGQPEQVLAALDRWMVTEEMLQTQRRFPDRATWEPKRGVWAAVSRGMNFGGRGYSLAGTAGVAATAVAVDEQRTLVRLEADLAPQRTERVWASGASALGGVGAGGVAAVVAATLVAPGALAVAAVTALALLPAAVGVGGAVAVARQHGAAVRRAQLALEQILDRLERGGAAALAASVPGSGRRPW